MKNVFGSRKRGATIRGKFYPLPIVTDWWVARVEKLADKMEIRRNRRG